MEEGEAARSGWASDAVLDFSLHSRKFDASAGAWNFGLCATRSREPRQARKGATVPGMPRVPQITRSSSHWNGFQLSVSVRGMQREAQGFFFTEH